MSILCVAHGLAKLGTTAKLQSSGNVSWAVLNVLVCLLESTGKLRHCGIVSMTVNSVAMSMIMCSKSKGSGDSVAIVTKRFLRRVRETVII